MHRGNQDSRAGVKQRALAATGLVATAAVGGLGVAAVTAAEAQAASGVVHACYNKSTHALKYAKGSKCPKGSKLVTWNKQGPQGAPGAKGAQGATGATGPAAGAADERFNQDLNIPADTSAVVASVTPGSAGYFAVNGFANVSPSHYAECWIQGGSIRSNSTPSGYTSVEFTETDVATTGIVQVPAAGTPIYEWCAAGTGGATVHHAAVTGIHLTTAHVVVAFAGRTNAKGAAAKNHFSKKK